MTKGPCTLLQERATQPSHIRPCCLIHLISTGADTRHLLAFSDDGLEGIQLTLPPLEPAFMQGTQILSI